MTTLILLPASATIAECNSNLEIQALVANPDKWLNKVICFEGKFSSYSDLALDYPPAMRSHLKYISLTLFRPETKIPLGELKLAYSIAEAKKKKEIVKLEEGQSVQVKGKVFSTALGEPWVDVLELEIIK